MDKTAHVEMREVLLQMVSLKRPYGSFEEGHMVPYLSRRFPLDCQWVDPAGNLHVDTRVTRWNRTLFVGHLDTVHRVGGRNKYRTDSKGIYASGAPLGADDAAGVSILSAMIGRVPGYYIFTRGEECGGIGSQYLADECPDILQQFDRAIAFDRKGTTSVITHQGIGRCCSDIFAEAVSSALNDQGMMYMPDDGGVYTDTAEFIDHIPECTNISVGYYFEHTKDEWLDTMHHGELLQAALVIDWDALPTRRDTREYSAPDNGFEMSMFDNAYQEWLEGKS